MCINLKYDNKRKETEILEGMLPLDPVVKNRRISWETMQIINVLYTGEINIFL